MSEEKENTYDLNTLMENETFKKEFVDLLNKEKGEAGRQAIERFRESELPKILDQEVDKRIEARSKKEPWQVKLEEMERQLAEEREIRKKTELQGIREKNTRLAMEVLSEKQLPSNLVEYFVTEDPETTKENINKFVEVMENHTSRVKQNLVKSETGGNMPPKSSDGIGQLEQLKQQLEQAIQKGDVKAKLALDRQITALQK